MVKIKFSPKLAPWSDQTQSQSQNSISDSFFKLNFIPIKSKKYRKFIQATKGIWFIQVYFNSVNNLALLLTL